MAGPADPAHWPRLRSEAPQRLALQERAAGNPWLIWPKAGLRSFTGTAQDLFATRAFPQAEILRFNSQADFVLAVKTGKVDAAITEAVSIRAIALDDPELAVLADDFYDMPIGAAFPKEDDRFASASTALSWRRRRRTAPWPGFSAAGWLTTPSRW
jgi:hypothetical protein